MPLGDSSCGAGAGTYPSGGSVPRWEQTHGMVLLILLIVLLGRLRWRRPRVQRVCKASLQDNPEHPTPDPQLCRLYSITLLTPLSN